MARRRGKKRRMRKFIAAEERENPRRDFDRDRDFIERMRGSRRGGMREGGRR